jgi:ribonuclease-3
LDRLAAAETALGITFRRKDILQRALIHRSYINERTGLGMGSNERLEFLGDAVLGMVVADHIYKTRPELTEGQLTDLRAALVRSRTLAVVAARLRLGDFLFMGRGESATGGRGRPLLLAQAFEAIVGAIFLDQGIDAVRRFILEQLAPELDRIDAEGEELTRDDKSRFQEVAQADVGITPTYEIVERRGPEHARVFVAEVRLGERAIARGEGLNRQEAEQAAARAALTAWAAP